jgi:hypothetical protein
MAGKATLAGGDPEPIDPAFVDVMKVVARALDMAFNGSSGVRKNGFVLFSFPFEGTSANRVNYISNARREDMILMVKEWLRRVEEEVGGNVEGDT